MGFEKVRMGKDIIFDSNVIDVDGRVLESWKVMRRDAPKVWNILNKKYDLGVKIIDKKMPEEPAESKEFDWAK